MSLAWCDDAVALVQDLTAEKTSTDYVLFRIENPKKKPTAVLAEAGQGGRERVVDYLENHAPDDAIVIGVFLCSAIDESGSAVSVRRKYIQVTWIGSSVSVMVKGKLGSWSGALREMFPAAALNVQLSGSDLQDLDADGLQTSLLTAGGAHKPTRYSFTNRTLIGSLSIDEAAAAAAEEERRRREAEIEAQRQAAAERKRMAEERRKREAEEKARLEAERKAAEEAERQRLEAERKAREAEEEARRKAEEEARLAQIRADEARRKAEEEAAHRAAEEAERQRLEAERLAREEAERQRTKIFIDTNVTLNGKTLVLLVSNLATNFAQSNQQERVRTMIGGLGLPKNEIEEVDGSAAINKEQRSELFALSGIRAKYPQVFMKDGTGKLSFFGDYDTMEYYNDTGTLAQTLGVVSSATKRIVAVGDCSNATSGSAATPDQAKTVETPEMTKEKPPAPSDVLTTVSAVSQDSTAAKEATETEVEPAKEASPVITTPAASASLGPPTQEASDAQAKMTGEQETPPAQEGKSPSEATETLPPATRAEPKELSEQTVPNETVQEEKSDEGTSTDAFPHDESETTTKEKVGSTFEQGDAAVEKAGIRMDAPVPPQTDGVMKEDPVEGKDESDSVPGGVASELPSEKETPEVKTESVETIPDTDKVMDPSVSAVDPMIKEDVDTENSTPPPPAKEDSSVKSAMEAVEVAQEEGLKAQA